MFMAMNRFRIARGREQEFIDIWRHRDSHLEGVPGFREFHLLQGPSDEEATLFASHSIWESEQAFADWTRSEAFRKANANGARDIYLGRSQFEGLNAVLW